MKYCHNIQQEELKEAKMASRPRLKPKTSRTGRAITKGAVSNPKFWFGKGCAK
jgi:hypothetical protein